MSEQAGEQRRRLAEETSAGGELAPYPRPLTEDALGRAVGRLHVGFDDDHGGFGTGAKSLHAPVLDLLVRAGARGFGRAKAMAERTLEAMADGGVHDRAGGGFHHGTTDRAWGSPQPGKLLADQALAARAYTHAWQAWREPLHRQVAEETLDYVVRELTTPSGGLAAGEGAGEDATADELPRDDRVLASLNGLAVGALAEAGAAFGRLDHVEAARRVAGVVADSLVDASGTVRHAEGLPGALEDHAHLAEGLLTLWEVTFERRWLELAAVVTDRMVEVFWDEEGGAFFSTSSGGADLSVRSRLVLDAPETGIPSPNAVAALVLLRLASLAGRDDHRDRAVRILCVAGPYMEAHPEATAGFFAALDLHALGPKEVAIAGDPTDPAAAALAAEAWARLVPNRVLAGGLPGSGVLLLGDRGLVDGHPAAHVREGGTWLPPTTDPAELGRHLRPWKTPSGEQVDAMVRRMEGAVQYRHLFDQLQNPRWLEPLRARGFFTTPPEPILDYSRGTIGSPPWPESGYLARAAVGDPATAHAIGLEIPDTANAQVHEDIADLALALPAPLAADLVPRLGGWAGLPYHLLMADKLGRLLVHLASGGSVDAALMLERSVLEVLPDPAQAAPGEDRFRPDPEPKPKFEEFEWTQIVNERIPELVDLAGPPALVVLCEALEDTIALSTRPGEDMPPEDHSYIWRPAIEEEPPSNQPLDVLLTAVRDAALSIARRGEVEEVVEILRGRTRHVFRRLALHVLFALDEAPAELVRSALLDRTLLADPHFHHEYLLLAADRFGDLSPEDREQVLAAVGEGPAQRVRDRLALLLDVVPPEWQERYRALVEEAGPPEHPEFAAPPGTGRRRNSPKGAEDLRRMGPEAVVTFLRTWQPPGGWARPSRDGLAHEVMLTVAADPEPFARRADRFGELDLAYVEALLFGLREATKRELAFPWEPVTALCRRLLDRPDGAGGDLAGIRREMAHLVSAGFATGAASLPFDQRTAVWDILRRLAEDPDPDPEQESRLLKAGVELAVISTNSTRGKALHATVRYGLWVRRHIEQGPSSVQRVMRGFEELPEVREVLDAHLSPRHDPSAALRVVYGWWLPWLVMLDPEWTRRRLGEILPRDRSLDEQRHAAWGAYVTFNTPYENVWNLLRGEYRRAADRLDPKASPDLRLPGPEERLAEHLLSVYWRGKLRLEDSESPLGRFFARAPDALAAHAVMFAGRSLPGWKGPVPGEVKLRLMKLWERRLGVARRGPASHQREMAAFGWWFATGLFEQRWAVDQLDGATELTGGRVDSTHMVVAKLAEAASAVPATAVRILARIVEGDRGRTIVGWRDQGRAVLSAVIEGRDEQAREAAMDLLDAFDVEDLPQDTTWESPAARPAPKRGPAAGAQPAP